MKRIYDVVGLLVLSALVVNANPFYPYGDKEEEEQKNAFVSDEAVAAYFKNKFETENVQPAMIMEYLINLMGASKKKPSSGSNKDAFCVSESTEYSLKRSQLEMILNTVYSQTGVKVHSTIITPDQGKDVYIDESCPLTAYQHMIGNTNQPSNIWVNYSPCPHCVKALIKEYEKSSNKPTIHIAKFYTESSSIGDAVKSLQCLAKLKRLGFSLESWDFVEFNKSAVSESTCKDEIDERFRDAKFTSEYMKLGSQLEFVRQISETPHASSWCESIDQLACPQLVN